LKARARAGKGKKGGKGGKGAASASGSESDLTASGRKKAPVKTQRKWVDSAPTEDDMANLDYSAEAPPATDGKGPLSDALLASLVDESSRGTRGKDGLYEVKDWEFLSKSGVLRGSDDDDDFISRVLDATPQGSLNNGTPATGQGYFGGLLSRLTGGKVLTKEDLTPVLNGMKEHLMKKNVAREIAEKVCESVGAGLEGKKVGGFKSMCCSCGLNSGLALTLIHSHQVGSTKCLVRRDHSNPHAKDVDRHPSRHPNQAF
jgi:signal recognition particle receptor subunit alpha